MSDSDDDAFTRAQDAVFAGDLPAAVELCKAAVGEDDADGAAHQLLVTCLMNLGRFDEAVDAGCDWGLGCGNSERQLQSVVEAAYLSDAPPMLQAGRDQMCSCEVSDSTFAACLAMCADIHVGFEPDMAARVAPRAAWGSDAPAAVPVVPPGAPSDEEKASSPPPGPADDDGDRLEVERVAAYTLFTAGKVPGFDPSAASSDAATCQADAVTKLQALLETCSPLNVSFVAALAVVLMLDTARRADAATVVSRAAERAPEQDTNLVGAGALVDFAIDPSGSASDLTFVCQGATPILRKRLQAALAAARTAK